MTDAQGQLAVLVIQLVVLALQAWFLYGTLKATKASADAAKLSAEATQVAADAAKKSAEISEKSVDSIERPYLLVEQIVPKIAELIGGSSAQPTMPHVVVALKNYGRSPALLLKFRACLELVQANQDAPFLPVLPLGNVVVVGSHERWERICYYQSAVGPGVKGQIDNQQLHLWIFLSISYEDMLGKEHQTQVRFRYEPRDNTFAMLTDDSYTIRT